MRVPVASEGTKLIVGIADLKLSRGEGDLLITYALGSCLGITIHDPVAGVGGLLHAMLPSATADKDRGAGQPSKFVDSGVTTLFKEAYRMGARKERIVLKVAGGASVANEGKMDTFQIGKRNAVALKKLLWKNGVLIRGEDLGGNISRTLSLDMASGEVRVKSNGKEFLL